MTTSQRNNDEGRRDVRFAHSPAQLRRACVETTMAVLIAGRYVLVDQVQNRVTVC